MEQQITKQEAPGTIVIQQITMTSVDRSPKDIATWRYAMRSAESMYSPNRVALLDLYEDVILDGHLTGVIGKRIGAVLNKNLHFETKDGKRVDALTELLESEQMADIIAAVIETKIYGVSGMEFVPGKKVEVKEIPRKHIKLEQGVIALNQNDQTGIPIADNKNLWVLGKPRKLGLLLQCSPYALYKKGNMADWAQYIEIFGQPIRVGKYDAYDTTTRQQLAAALNQSGGSLAIMIPKQAELEILDGKQSNGDGKLQDTFRAACNEEMSVIILGNTETTSSSRSSGYAQAKEHGKQQLAITALDMMYVLQQLNTDHFKAILKSYGYPVENGSFAFEKEHDLSELIQRIEIDMQIASKVPFDDDYWYRTYGIDKPDNYDELKAKMEAASVEAPASNPTNQNPAKPDPKRPTAVVRAPTNHNSKTTPADDLTDREPSNLWRRIRTTLADFFDPAP
jgi:phage gp29-like protein